jgi:hypothetical protein
MAKKVTPQGKKAETKSEPKKVTKRTGFKIAAEPYDVAVPPGFNFLNYKPLKKKNFATEALYYEHRVAEMDFKSDSFAAQAEEARKFGDSKQRNKAKKIVKLNEKMAELRKQLTAQGINVDELLKAQEATS